MFKRILVPLDGSPTANRGLDQAIKLARSQGATLYLLHVVDERGFIEHFDVVASLAITETLLASLRDRGRKIIDNARAKAAKHMVRVRPILIENLARRVADLIVENARKHRTDLIVMGTHGRRGITRLVIGSDAEGVIRATPVPVLLVRDSRPKP